jgi:hypothetical protein
VQKILNLPAIQAQGPAAAPGAGDLMPGDPGYDEAGSEPADIGARGLPQFPSVEDAEAGKVPPKGRQKLGQLAASVGTLEGTPLFYAADSAVRRALELAGGRLVPGPQRARYPVPKHELHTRVAASATQVPTLLAGAWSHVREQAPALGVDPDALESVLGGYCTELLTRGVAHEPGLLSSMLHHTRGDLAP